MVPARQSVPAPAPATDAFGFPHAAPDRRRRTLRWVAVGAAAFLVGGAAAGGVLLTQGKDGKKHGKEDQAVAKDDKPVVTGPSQGPAPSPSPFGSPSASPSASASSEPSGSASPVPSGSASAPAGYALRTDPLGFTFAVPDGWNREAKGSMQTDFTAPTGGAYLRVGMVVKSPQSAYAHFEELEKGLKDRNPTFKRVSLTKNTFQGQPGARWEFTWTERDTGRTMHAVDQAYVNEAGTEYAVYFQSRDDQWSGSRTVFDTAVSTWSVIPVDFG
ncbi:hypothetical protein ACFQ2B_13885 [Streptomyces stramineus]